MMMAENEKKKNTKYQMKHRTKHLAFFSYKTLRRPTTAKCLILLVVYSIFHGIFISSINLILDSVQLIAIVLWWTRYNSLQIKNSKTFKHFNIQKAMKMLSS